MQRPTGAHALAQAARAEVAAREEAARNAEARCMAAEQSLKEERSREGSYHQYQQVRAGCPRRGSSPTKASWHDSARASVSMRVA